MTDLEVQAVNLVDRAEKASSAERIRLQPQIARVVTALTMQGRAIPRRLQNINRALSDEAMDDMFDNMPV